MSTFLRAAVMLLVLVGVPIAWMYVGPLPVESQEIVTKYLALAKVRLGMVPSTTVSRQNKKETTKWNEYINTDENRIITEFKKDPQIPNRELLFTELRNMGIDSFQIEAWGRGKNLYRFCCKVPIGPSGDLTRQFEEVNENPEAAITNVIHEIITWRQNRYNSL